MTSAQLDAALAARAQLSPARPRRSRFLRRAATCSTRAAARTASCSAIRASCSAAPRRCRCSATRCSPACSPSSTSTIIRWASRCPDRLRRGQLRAAHARPTPPDNESGDARHDHAGRAALARGLRRLARRRVLHVLVEPAQHLVRRAARSTPSPSTSAARAAASRGARCRRCRGSPRRASSACSGVVPGFASSAPCMIRSGSFILSAKKNGDDLEVDVRRLPHRAALVLEAERRQRLVVRAARRDARRGTDRCARAGSPSSARRGCGR